MSDTRFYDVTIALTTASEFGITVICVSVKPQEGISIPLPDMAVIVKHFGYNVREDGITVEQRVNTNE